MVVDDEMQPLAKDWLEEQMRLQSSASDMLRQERAKNMNKRNLRRTAASYQIDDFVLVHKQRFPTMRPRKLEIQWHWPFRVTKIYPSAVKIRTSPRLGGEILVSHTMLKRFPMEENWEEEKDDED